MRIHLSDSTKTTNHHCKLATLNAQSVCNKIVEITDFITEEKPDFAFITETWLNESNEFVCDQITPPGYVLAHTPRIGKRGGGTAIISKSVYNPKVKPSKRFDTFETTCNDIILPNGHLRLACVYRPPGTPNKQFFDEFSDFLEEIALDNSFLVVAGDFNIHMDKTQDPSTIKFTNILDEFNLNQHVNMKTHHYRSLSGPYYNEKRHHFDRTSDHWPTLFGPFLHIMQR